MIKKPRQERLCRAAGLCKALLWRSSQVGSLAQCPGPGAEGLRQRSLGHSLALWAHRAPEGGRRDRRILSPASSSCSGSQPPTGQRPSGKWQLGGQVLRPPPSTLQTRMTRGAPHPPLGPEHTQLLHRVGVPFQPFAAAPPEPTAPPPRGGKRGPSPRPSPSEVSSFSHDATVQMLRIVPFPGRKNLAALFLCPSV